MEEQTNSSASRRLAILVDGDNAQASLTGGMLAEASKYGLASIRRVYGDWTTPSMNSWKDTLQQFAMQPIQQFQNTVGKNATDSALIIDAMDILYSDTVGGFCIVSSDSDYTRLATRIRETGAFVMGIGRGNTPKSFVNACNVFVFTEIIARQGDQPTELPLQETKTPAPADPVPLLRRAYDLAAREDGYAFLGNLGHHLRQLDPSFDPRSYGHAQLSMLIKEYPNLFTIREDRTPEGPIHMWVRLKK